MPAGRLGVGTHALTARYSGDATYAASQGTAQVKVDRATSRTVATGTATVTVRRDGWTLVTRTVPLAAGRGSVLLPRLPAGRYRVTATYRGSTTVERSTDTASLRVVRRR